MYFYGKIFFLMLYRSIRSGSKFTFLFTLGRIVRKKRQEWTFPIFVNHTVYFTPISYASVNYRFVFSKLRFFD